jgi:hypothetical protein
MRKVDREALQRAIQTAKADPVQRQWIIDKIRDQGWEDAALSAAYHCQVETLHLRPWQEPPCWAGDDRPVDDGTHCRVERGVPGRGRCSVCDGSASGTLPRQRKAP